MRAVFVLSGLGPGGAERVVSLIAGDWAAAGDDVTVIAFDGDADPVYHSFDPRVTLVRLGSALPRRPGPLLQLGRLSALRRAFARLRPQIIVSFLTKVNALTLLASVGNDVPVIVSERNNLRRQSLNPLWLRLLARLYGRAAAIVLQTEASRACLPPAARAGAVVIPNPVAAAANGPPAASPPQRTLAAVGRLEPQKGFDLLLEAFAAVADDARDWRLVIWGAGPDRAALEARRRRLGLDDRVDLPGLTSVPGGWTQAATAFVLSSRFEGFPNVLGEAMANGLPVVAVDCDFGPREMITHEVDGLLVENGDVAALAAALRRLMHDAALRARLGDAARRTIRRYDVGAVLGAWRTLARRLTSPPTR